MTSLCCIDLPALPLQLLFRVQPSWRKYPVVVVAEDRPTAEVLLASTAAMKRGIARGMRLGAARATSRELRAGVVGEAELRAEADAVFRLLYGFSPRIEPCTRVPGRFYADPSGLAGLFGSPEAWAAAVHEALVSRGLTASVVVGFHRARVTAIAGTRRGVLVLRDEAKERALAGRVALVRLGLSHDALVSLARLEVRSVADLLKLPADALGRRFGEEVRALAHALGTGTPMPVQGAQPAEPVSVSTDVEPPDDDVVRLLFVVRGALVAALARGHESVARLELVLSLERAPAVTLSLEPAQPTRDETLLCELVRLRLSALALAAPVETLKLVVHGARGVREQLPLFPVPKKQRDVKAAARALARLRAAFGTRAVTRAREREMHLPEASFAWEEATTVALPRPTAPREETPRLARRLLPKPQLLQDPPRVADDPWPTTDRAHGPLMKLAGPYRLSGGWWAKEVERDYYWAETRRGDLLWVYYDRPRRKWFLHAVVD